MIFTILVAMIPLSILSQGVTNSTVYSPDCKKAINAVDYLRHIHAFAGKENSVIKF